MKSNAFAGIVAAQVDPAVGVDGASMALTLQDNIVQGNGTGLFVPGGIGDDDGGTHDTKIAVTSSDNTYTGNLFGIAIQGAVASPNSPVEDSTAIFRSRSDRLTNNALVALSVTGAGRSPTTPQDQVATSQATPKTSRCSEAWEQPKTTRSA